MTEKKCTLCGKVKNNGIPVVDNPSYSLIDALIKKATDLKNGGISEYGPLVEHMSSLSKEEKIKQIHYHRVCRNSMIRRKCNTSGGSSEEQMSSPPAKVGRPSSTSTGKTQNKRTSLRSPGEAPKPKEVKCVFS